MKAEEDTIGRSAGRPDGLSTGPPTGVPLPEPLGPNPPMTEALEFDLTLFPTPVLRKEADKVTTFDDDLKKTVEAMFTLMFESHGVGLAAPQVGLKRSILVLNPEGDKDKPELNRVLINPKITGFGSDKNKHEEGCLSFPGIYAEVERPDRCTVEFVDADGQATTEEFDGWEARIVQHEYDHLMGILLVDRMSPADKVRNRAALEELIERYKASK